MQLVMDGTWKWLKLKNTYTGNGLRHLGITGVTFQDEKYLFQDVLYENWKMLIKYLQKVL